MLSTKFRRVLSPGKEREMQLVGSTKGLQLQLHSSLT